MSNKYYMPATPGGTVCGWLVSDSEDSEDSEDLSFDEDEAW